MNIKGKNMEKILILIIGVLLGITIISTIYLVHANKIKNGKIDVINGKKSQNIMLSPKEIHDRENEKIDFKVEKKYDNEKNKKYEAKNVEKKQK